MGRMLRTAGLIAGLQSCVIGIALAHASSTAWVLETQKDPMTDAAEAVAVTRGPDGAQAMFACSSGKLAWLIEASTLDFVVDDTRAVQLRIDHEPPETDVWHSASEGGVILVGDDAAELAKRVAAAKEQFVFNTGGGTVAFSVVGASQAINKVLQTCASE